MQFILWPSVILWVSGWGCIYTSRFRWKELWAMSRRHPSLIVVWLHRELQGYRKSKAWLGFFVTKRSECESASNQPSGFEPRRWNQSYLATLLLPPFPFLLFVTNTGTLSLSVLFKVNSSVAITGFLYLTLLVVVVVFPYSFSLVLERSSLSSSWFFCRYCSHLYRKRTRKIHW